MSNNLTVLATFEWLIPAESLREALTEAGIESRLSDQYIVTTHWLISNAVGGIKVMVMESDAARAVEVYRKWEEEKEQFAAIDDAELERQALEAGLEEESDSVEGPRG